MPRPVVYFLLLCILFISKASAFIWKLTDVLPADRVLQFSEKYMFATHDGPDVLDQGDSYIDLKIDLISYMEVNRTTEVAYAIFAANSGHEHDTLLGMCSSKNSKTNTTKTTPDENDDDMDIHVNTWASNVFAQRVKSEYVDTVHVFTPTFGGNMLLPNGTYYRWRAVLNTHYTVNTEAWHNVAFQLCDSEIVDPKAHVDGSVTFKNPYGYLPAELFGFLPFEGVRTAMFALFGCYYFYQYCKHRASTLPLHKATLVVFLIAFVEAGGWFVAYEAINESGTPYCCPFPTTVVVALVLQVFRQTFSRMLLLVVCLGYGIVRPRLLTSEWVAVTVITTLYFIGAIVAHVSEIVMVHDVHDDSPENVLTWQVPAMILDVVLLSWIYLALGSTIRILTEFKQTNKLKLFTSLNNVINFFVSMFSIMTVFVLLDKANVLSWPWKWTWLEAVLWEILNFGILSAVCVICLPSDNSLLLSYASQLPTEDPGEDDAEVDRYDDYDPGESDDEVPRGGGSGVQMQSMSSDDVPGSYAAKNPVAFSSGRADANKKAKKLASFSVLEDEEDDDNAFADFDDN
jgi:hypothetical protein